MDTLGSLAALLGALGFGTVLGQWVAAAKDRRSSRADVLTALGAVEAARWVPTGGSDAGFRQAARALTTAALLARIPQRAVRDYLVFAQAARWLSQDSWDTYPELDSGGGAVDGEFAHVVRDAAHLVAQLAWSTRSDPRRWALGRRLGTLRARADACDERTTVAALDRSRKYGMA